MKTITKAITESQESPYMYNLTIRVLSDQTLYVSYQEDGKAKDGSFPAWQDFVNWIQKKIQDNLANKEAEKK